jgi:hypothetical protein
MNVEQWLDEFVKNNPEMTRKEGEQFLKELLEMYATKGIKPPPRYDFTPAKEVSK